MKYTLQRWKYLLNYLQDGRYEIDNNGTERAIKPFACAEKIGCLQIALRAHMQAREFFS